MTPTPSDLGRVIHVDFNPFFSDGRHKAERVERILIAGHDLVMFLSDDNSFKGGVQTWSSIMAFGELPTHWEDDCDGCFFR